MELLAAILVVYANAEEGITGPRFLQAMIDDYPHLSVANMGVLGNYNFPITAEIISSVFLTGEIGATDFKPELHFDQAIQQGGVIAHISKIHLTPNDPENVPIVDVMTDIYETERETPCSSVIVYKPT